jgi:hypothetical protein
VVVLSLLLQLRRVYLGAVVRPAPVGDDVDLVPFSCVVYEALRRLVYLYALLAKLRGTLDAREERDNDDRCYGDQGNRDAGGLLDYVRHGRVEGHDRDHPETERR